MDTDLPTLPERHDGVTFINFVQIHLQVTRQGMRAWYSHLSCTQQVFVLTQHCHW